MVAITVAILGIDFPAIFLRSNSKSEEYGISLMDIGVAVITLNAGISSRKARPWYYK
jgi:glucosaminylphosphatidylinositol acyltransferase